MAGRENSQLRLYAESRERQQIMTLNLDDLISQLQALVDSYDAQEDFASYHSIEREMNRLSNEIITFRIKLREKRDSAQKPVLSATQTWHKQKRGEL